MAAAVLVGLFTCAAEALDLEVRPLAEGYRTGHWTPIRVTVATGLAPFEGEVVLRLGDAQVHRVPMSLPPRARREVTVGVLPFRPAERLEVEAGERRLGIDLRMAAGPLLAAEAGLADQARRERGAAVAIVGDEEASLWEGFDEVLISRETARRRFGLMLDAPQAWVRPHTRPWGVEWGTGASERRGIPSIQSVWTGRLRPHPWGPSGRRRFLIGLAALLGVMTAAFGLSAKRGRRTRALVVGVSALAATVAAAAGPAPRTAVTAFCIVGRRSDGVWQSRGFGCASRGSKGDVALDLPGLPRPLFPNLDAAQGSRWGVVWSDSRRLVFPERASGQGCWFEWQSELDLRGRVVGLRDGGAANELTVTLRPAVLLAYGGATVAETLRASEALTPAPQRPLPWPWTHTLMLTLDPRWHRGRHFLGRLDASPPGLGEVDLVEAETWIWAPLD